MQHVLAFLKIMFLPACAFVWVCADLSMFLSSVRPYTISEIVRTFKSKLAQYGT